MNGVPEVSLKAEMLEAYFSRWKAAWQEANSRGVALDHPFMIALDKALSASDSFMRLVDASAALIAKNPTPVEVFCHLSLAFYLGWTMREAACEADELEENPWFKTGKGINIEG